MSPVYVIVIFQYGEKILKDARDIAIFVENPSPWRSLRGWGGPQPHHMMSPSYVIVIFQYGQKILKDARDIAIFVENPSPWRSLRGVGEDP